MPDAAHADAARAPPTSLFVAGATGYTGQAVVARAAAVGMTVWAHVRPDSPDLATWRGRIAAAGARIDVTPWEADAMARQLAALQPEAIVLALGTTRRRAGRERLVNPYRTIDYGLTAMVIDAAHRAGHRPQVVYLSAMGTGTRLGPSAYLNARVRAERHLRESGLPAVIARPGLVGGPDRPAFRPAEHLSRVGLGTAARLFAALGLRRLAAQLTPIDAATLARALVALARDRQAAGQVVDAAGLHDRAAVALVRR